MTLGTKRGGLLAIAMAAALAIAGCTASGPTSTPTDTTPTGATPTATGPTASGAPSRAELLTIAPILEPTSLDPAQAQEGHPIQWFQAVYDTLIRRQSNGDLVPMLANTWEWSDDALELTLQLRDDVDFTDGTHFNAAAVKANLDRFKDAGGPQAGTVSAVKEVVVDSEYTARIVLTKRDPALPITLSNAAGFMASPAALNNSDLATNPVGSGPYTLDASRTTSGSQTTFVANPDYWDPSLQKFDTIVMKPISDLNARLNALLTGQVDATQLDPNTAVQAESAGNKLHKLEDGQRGFFLFDRAGSLLEPLGDVRVRQAINLAIDRKAIVDQVLQGFGSPTTQIFGTATLAYQEALDSQYTYDPDAAKKLLAEAGYADGFTLTAAASSPNPTEVAAIQQYLADVGITLQIVDVPAQNNIAELTSGNYPAIYFTLVQPNDWTQITATLAPDALYNPLGSTDATTEKLLGEIQTQTSDEAGPTLQDLNKHIVEEAWFAPLFRSARVYFTGPKVDVEMQVQQAAPSIYNYTPIQ